MISNAPSKLKPKTTKSSAMKPLTQGLCPSATTPTGPSAAVTSNPIPENSTMMPMQNVAACRTLPCLFMK